MEPSELLIQMIASVDFVVSPVTEASNLYSDLGYDSLALVKLLLEIEEVFSIRFDLMEMGLCLKTGRLIALVIEKVKEQKHDKALADGSREFG